MNLNVSAFRELALAALDELDERAEATEIRRVDVWVEKFVKEVRAVKADFGGDELGERDPSAEDISYGDLSVDLGDEAAELECASR